MSLIYVDIIQSFFDYLQGIDILEAFGLIFGLLCVGLLIRENIYTWPAGIIYVLISFVIFWQQRLYGDLLLHIFFLILNIYGWYYWVKGNSSNSEEVPITRLRKTDLLYLLFLSFIGILIFGYFLESLPLIFKGLPQASLPYWDSTTSILSVGAMWLTARKKIENWYLWFIIDILATGIYFYKGIEFYAILYLVYIVLAILGYNAWKKSMIAQGSTNE